MGINDNGRQFPRPKTNSSNVGSSKERKDFYNEEREKPDTFFNNYPLKEEWILVGADEDMVGYAEIMGEYMAPKGKSKEEKDRDRQCLTKSQIRNVFGELKRIQGNFSEQISSFYLLKPKVAYAEGRKKTHGMTLFKRIFDKAWELVDRDEKRFLNFCNLMEAIIAYHKAYGGKD